MDPLTHALLTYSIIFWLRKIREIPAKYVVPLLIGSILPDVDYALSWIAYFAPKLYWLGHRGIGHSFVGVIPLVIIAAVILNQQKIKGLFWKKEHYPDLDFLSVGGVIAIYLGTLCHFLADFFVPSGMMILFPFSMKWYGVKVLSTNNIHTIVAIMFLTTVWPLRWNKARQNQLLVAFMVVFTLFGIIRVVACVNSINTFEKKYGETEYFASNELIYSHYVNYKVFDSSDPENKTYVIAIIDGLKNEFVSEEFIPEYRIFANSSAMINLGMNLINITKQNDHYFRLWQKNEVVCVIAEQIEDDYWAIRWFAPVRNAENAVKTAFIDRSADGPETIFHMKNDGTITKIIRPLSV